MPPLNQEGDAALPQPPIQARLLVVDDEPHIRSALVRALGLMGYSAEGAGSGQEALALLGRGHYDLMVLDMHLPGIDGMEIMRRAQQVSPGLLIVILTGHATLESAIAAVKSEEVVDYLLKPASVHKVAAAVTGALRKRAEQREKDRLVRTISDAVQALRQADRPVPARQAEPANEPVVRAPPLVLDVRRRQLAWEDDPARTVELTEGEAAVLAFLMARPDQVCTYSELARAAWGYSVDEADAQRPVRSYVFRLRHKIETDPDHPHLIRTIRGTGYSFVPPKP